MFSIKMNTFLFRIPLGKDDNLPIKNKINHPKIKRRKVSKKYNSLKKYFFSNTVELKKTTVQQQKTPEK